MNADGDVDRDHHGNARGGIRLPHLAVPIAQYGPVGTPALLRVPRLRQAVLRPSSWPELYPSRDNYLERFDAATRDAVESGFLLEPDAVRGTCLRRRRDP